MEEKVKLLDTGVAKTYKILVELNTILYDFNGVSIMEEDERKLFFKDRIGLKKKLRISFHSEEEIDRMTALEAFKLNVRGMLGIRSQEDWIFNFNIGNIMHLSPLNFDDLNRTQVDVVKELGKDKMMEKILYACAGLFCIGTELRFIANKH